MSVAARHRCIALVFFLTAWSVWTAAAMTNGWVRRTDAGAPLGRVFYTTVWTGSEMIIWGGASNNFALNAQTKFGDGGRYNPVTDTWTPVNTNGAPAAREYHVAVWTGTEMIIWGGFDHNALGNGGRYNPQTDTWSPVNTNGAPTARWSHAAVWTGSEMIIWGGYNPDALGTTALQGGRYNPASDTWTPVTTAGEPFEREYPTAVWTGREMIVWGGADYGFPGGRYNPVSDTWKSVNLEGLAGRLWHTVVWTDREMIVWGGVPVSSGWFLQTGGRYNPETDRWTTITTNGAPIERYNHTAVWTGNEMIVWGGYGGQPCCQSGDFGDGGRYDPTTDHWTTVGTSGAPRARSEHSSVWTGSEMIIWGGGPDTFLNDTWSYFPNGPNLRISLTPTNSAVLAWPVWSIPFTLQQNSDLGSANWSPVTNPAPKVGVEYQVIDFPTVTNRYYRLQSQ